MDGMGDAWMGAKTDITHDVQIGGMDDTWTSAMIDMMHNVWTGCTDDARMGATTDVLYDVLMVGDFTGFCAGNLPYYSPHNYRGFSTGLRQTVTS